MSWTFKLIMWVDFRDNFLLVFHLNILKSSSREMILYKMDHHAASFTYRCNNSLTNYIKEVFIMGGNYKQQYQEFNFSVDPVASYIVLKHFSSPYLVTYEVAKQKYLTVNHFNVFCSRENRQSKFFKSLFEKMDYFQKVAGISDAVAMAVALERNVITKLEQQHVSVDMEGHITRGSVSIHPENSSFSNINFVTDIDVEFYIKSFLTGCEM